MRDGFIFNREGKATNLYYWQKMQYYCKCAYLSSILKSIGGAVNDRLCMVSRDY